MNTTYLAKLTSPIPTLNGRPVAGRWVEVEPSRLSRLGPDPRIEAIVPNTIFKLEEARPNDLDPRQWSLERIHAPQAWSRSTGANGPIVAVLDTGLDTRHPDLHDNLWTNPGEIAGNGLDDDGNGVCDDVHGMDAVHGSGDIDDGGEHGTHVAGIIAARGDNGQGISGINWQGRLMGIKVFDDNGNTDVASVCRGIAYATENGATLLNCSWGGAVPFNQALYESLRDFPGLVVCSAGNTGADNDTLPHYPSSFELDNLVAVAATSRQDHLCFTSCYGARSVDLAAPGEQILSTVPGGGYKVKSGTSQATPHVTGVAALLSSLQPQVTPQQLKEQLLASVDSLPDLQGRVLSGGLLNADKALSLVQRGGHGPHLLREFYHDIEESRAEAQAADNHFPDRDDRRDRLDMMGEQQTMVLPHGLALREIGPDGEPAMLVWLEARREGDTLMVDQRGFERDHEGYYAFPIRLQGSPDKPFDPPEAERISAEQFQAAVDQFSEQWKDDPEPARSRQNAA